MSSGKQYIYGFIVLLGLGFMGWYYAQPQATVKLSHQQLANLPDATFIHLKVTQFNDAGQIASLLTIPQLVHYPANNTSIMQSPIITLYRPQQPPWVITARHGKSEQGSTQITLWEDVVLHQASGVNTKESTISTSKIVYFPKQQFATTDQNITLQQPGVIVHSQGMNAYLSQQRVQLLHQARGQYVKTN